MKVLLYLIGIQLIIYIVMIVCAYRTLKKDQEYGYMVRVTVKDVFKFWLDVCYIPFFGPLIILTTAISFGVCELKDWFEKTRVGIKFNKWFQNILNKEI